MSSIKIACVIPARMKSTRLPGKPLVDICGIPMVVRVYDRVKDFDWSDIVVATDSEEIGKVCTDHGIKYVMTSEEHSTGTDRIAEAMQSMDCDYIVNVQGDEPIIPKDNVQNIIDAIKATDFEVINAYTEAKEEEVNSPNIIKTVVNNYDRLVYMSRNPIPFSKDGGDIVRYKQVCVYGFSRYALDWFSKNNECLFEKSESIEILRFMESPSLIPYMVKVSPGTIAVDVPDDVKKVEDAINAGI